MGGGGGGLRTNVKYSFESRRKEPRQKGKGRISDPERHSPSVIGIIAEIAIDCSQQVVPKRVCGHVDHGGAVGRACSGNFVHGVGVAEGLDFSDRVGAFFAEMIKS